MSSGHDQKRDKQRISATDTVSNSHHNFYLDTTFCPYVYCLRSILVFVTDDSHRCVGPHQEKENTNVLALSMSIRVSSTYVQFICLVLSVFKCFSAG
jgi:hypothetical protein